MKRIVLISCMLYYSTAFAQEMWGIANSNFAASAGMSLNPSAMVLMPYKWEATLISGNISFQNNYIGFQRHKLEATTAEGTPDPHGGIVDYYTSGDKSSNLHVMLRLPSITFRTPTMAFGFHVAARTDLSIRNVPSTLARFAYEGLTYSSLFGTGTSIDGMHLGEMSWVEAGISAGKALSKNPEKKWVGGVTLKGIAGIQAVYFKTKGGGMNIVNDSTVTIDNFSADMYSSLPESPEQVLAMPNRGIGADLGVCYVSNPHREHFENGKLLPVKKYDYRVGISLIDIGMVQFNAGIRNYHFNNQSASFDRQGSGLDQMMSDNETSTRFYMALPTALSVQYDKCLKPKMFLNFSGIQRIPMPMPHIDRANQLSATLRYETTFFEVAVPYSFYDYYLHRIGVALRYRILFLGTDKVGTFINNDEITGVDFYFGLRLTNFDFAGRTKSTKKVCPAYL